MSKIEFIPRNEIQTREWFCYHLDEFEYSIVDSQRPFPDYTLRDGNGNIVLTELEYVSSNFINHKHDPDKCDLVMCWVHDMDLPLPVFELSTKTFYEAGTGAKDFERSFDSKGEYLQLDSKTIKACSEEINIFRQSFTNYFQESIKLKKEHEAELNKIKRNTGYSMSFFKVVGAIRQNINDDMVKKLDTIPMFPDTIFALISGKKCYF